MAANTDPIFPLAPKVGMVQISTANTNRNGTGTMGDVLTAGVEGARIERGRVKATGTTTAGMVRFFLHDGTNTHLIAEVNVTAVTPSGTQKAFEAEVPELRGQLVPATWVLRASTHNAETFNVIAEYGDF